MTTTVSVVEEIRVSALAGVALATPVAQHDRRSRTCKRVGAQICSLGAAFGGLAGGFELAGATA